MRNIPMRGSRNMRNTTVKNLLADVGEFSRRLWPRYALREYQATVAREIGRSVLSGEGRQFAVVFSRQAGKDEMLAQLEAYLMFLHRLKGGSILVVNPTFR